MEFLVRGAVEHNEPGVFVAFEENEEELTRNVASLGFDLNALSAKKKIDLDTSAAKVASGPIVVLSYPRSHKKTLE